MGIDKPDVIFPEVPTDGKCYCPYDVDESEVVEGKHRLCGGTREIVTKTKKRKK